ncbi:MAG: DUF4388 domain-containing protein [Myxococcota bacterium]
MSLATLLHVAATRATGEFIAAADELEVHVYLQEGRVAWATSSTERLLFSRVLVETTSLTPELLQDIFQVCLRERRKLGETLLSHGLATLEQVRGALRAQIDAALQALQRSPHARTLFLPRKQSFRAYDAALTFALDELGYAVPPEHDELLTELHARAPQLAWSAVLEDQRPVRRRGEGAPGQLPADLLDGAATMVLLKSAWAATLGVRLAASRHSLWCGGTRSLGAAVDFLEARCCPPPPLTAAGRQPLDVSPAVSDAVRALVERSPWPTAVVRLGASPWALSTSGEAARAAGRAQVLQHLFELDLHAARTGSVQASASPVQSALVVEREHWWFGVDFCPAPAALWLALPRSAARGHGWSLLHQLSRLATPAGNVHPPGSPR